MVPGFSQVLVATLLVLLTEAQSPPLGPGPGPCLSEFQSSLETTCIRPTGMALSGVLFLISDNTTGSPPTGVSLEQFRQSFCSDSNQDAIVPCILKLVLGYVINDTRCVTSDRAAVDQSGRQFLMASQVKCSETCEQTAVSSVAQCFDNVQLNPGRVLNSSIADDRFPLIATMADQGARFCSSAGTLFACLKQVRAACSSVQKQLHTLGIDIDSMESSTSLICSRREAYTAAHRCFAQPNPAAATCRQQAVVAVNQVATGRFSTGDRLPSQFQSDLCRARLQQIACELAAFSPSCSAQQVSLRTTFECSNLPAPCRSVPEFQQSLAAKCQQTTQATLPSNTPSSSAVNVQTPTPGSLLQIPAPTAGILQQFGVSTLGTSQQFPTPASGLSQPLPASIQQLPASNLGASQQVSGQLPGVLPQQPTANAGSLPTPTPWGVQQPATGSAQSATIGGNDPTAPCQNAFTGVLNQCITNNSLNLLNVMWVMTNQTSGRPPQDSTSFRAQMCSSAPQVRQCWMTGMPPLASSSLCLPSPGQLAMRLVVDDEMRRIVGVLDRLCPDRNTPPELPACEAAFVQNMFQCSTNSSIAVPGFLWLVTNGVRGQAPADQTAFLRQACSNRIPIVQCGSDSLQQLLNSSSCQPIAGVPDRRQDILIQFQNIAATFERSCGNVVVQDPPNAQNAPNLPGTPGTAAVPVASGVPALPGSGGNPASPVLPTGLPGVQPVPPAVAPGVIPGVFPGPQTGTCESTFLSNLYQCVTNSSLNLQNFVWLATNQTAGQVPTDQNAFRTLACRAQDQVMRCASSFMRPLLTSSLCQGDQGRQIDGQLRGIAANYDTACRNPCLTSLSSDLRQCFVEATINLEELLNNRRLVIGATQSQATQYCSNREALTACLKKKRDACPGSRGVLLSMDLDIDAMDKGVAVVCRNQTVYLAGVACFSETTPDVDRCLQSQSQEMARLAEQAERDQWPLEQFTQQTCRIRVQKMECELKAWTQKQHPACTSETITQRTELECALIPDSCAAQTSAAFDQVCRAPVPTQTAPIPDIFLFNLAPPQ